MIYGDALENGWTLRAWASAALSNPSPAHSGTASIAVTCQAYEALDLRAPDFSAAPYTNLLVWLHGGAAGGQSLTIEALVKNKEQTPVTLPALPPNAWTRCVIPLADLGVAGAMALDGFLYLQLHRVQHANILRG